MSNLVNHAVRELELAGFDVSGSDEMNREMLTHLIDMVTLFSKAGHSGSSAGYSIAILNKLLRYEPLTALTDHPDEWICHDEATSGQAGGLWQNSRDGRAFSLDGGKTYYLLGERRRSADWMPIRLRRWVWRKHHTWQYPFHTSKIASK